MITNEPLNEQTFEEMNQFLVKIFNDWTRYAATHLEQQERIRMLIDLEEFKQILEILEMKYAYELDPTLPSPIS